MQPKISVIVPVYKAEKYLHRCVDSILAQTFTDFELLLIDDGSPDNSGAICDEYATKDCRVRVFHKENGGVSSARNLGLDNARGEWITFIDSDDYIDERYFNIPNSCNEDLLIQNYTFFGDSNKSVRFSESIIKEDCYQDFINENLHKEWLRTPWAKFYKSNIIKDYCIKFPDGIKIGEDTLFVQEYLYHITNVRYIDTGYYMYYCNYDYSRYFLCPQDAITIFHRFIVNYKKLNADNIDFLDLSFNFYWGLTNPKNYKKENRVWYRDDVVKKVYKIVRKKRNIKWWIKYNLYKILS